MPTSKYFYVVGIYCSNLNDRVVSKLQDTKNQTFFSLARARKYAKELEREVKEQDFIFQKESHITIDIERFNDYNALNGEECDLNSCVLISSLTIQEGGQVR